MLTHIQLTNFRIHKSTNINIVDKFSALVGKNDIGKSSVLEALDILCNSGKCISEDDKTQGSTDPANVSAIINGKVLDLLSPTIAQDRQTSDTYFYKFGIDDNEHNINLNQDLNSLIELCNQRCDLFVEQTYPYHTERKKIKELISLFTNLRNLYAKTQSSAIKDFIDEYLAGNRDLQRIISKKQLLFSNCQNQDEKKYVTNIFDILSQFELNFQDVLNCNGLTTKAKQLIKKFEETGDSNLVDEIQEISFDQYNEEMESFILLMDKPCYISLTKGRSVDESGQNSDFADYETNDFEPDDFDQPEAESEWIEFKEIIGYTYLNGRSQINDIQFFNETENRDLVDLIFVGSLEEIYNKSDEILARFDKTIAAERENDIVYLWEKYLRSFGSVDIKLAKRGSGFKRLCDIYNFLMTRLSNFSSYFRSIIFAVEEPEISLHPSQQRDIVNRLRDILRLPNTQVIISTHSPFIVNALDEKSVCILKRESQTDANGNPIETVTTSAMAKRIIKYSSMAEINYLAFDEPSITYHQELYGQIEVECLGESNGNKIGDIIDTIWKGDNTVWNTLISKYNRIPNRPFEIKVKNVFSSPDNDGKDKNGNTLYYYVPYCVRNAIDHPGDMNKQWKNNISVVDLSIKMLIEIYKAVEKAENSFLPTINSNTTDLDDYGHDTFKCSGTSDTNEHSLVYWVKYQIDHPNECLIKQKNDGKDITHGEIKNKINFVKAMYDIDYNWLNK